MTSSNPNGTIMLMAANIPRRAAPREWTEALARRIRIARGKMTQQELADRLGVKKPSISSWEHGDTAPSLDNLDQLSQIFGLPIDWFMGRGPEDLPNQIASGDQLSRRRFALAAAAVVQASIEARRLCGPEDMLAMILATHDWAASNEEERGTMPPFEETVTFVRHAMKMRQHINPFG